MTEQPFSADGLSPAEKRDLLARLVSKREARPASFPLSFNQERLWFLDQLNPGDASFNIYQPLTLQPPIDIPALKRSLNEIVRRHEILRTTFQLVDDRPVQVVSQQAELPLPVDDLSSVPAEERQAEALRRATEEAATPFDLATGPLIRSRLLRLSDREIFLLLTMHHIVSDGWSLGIFFQELTDLYMAFAFGRPSRLAPLPVQYGDYSLWQREHLSGAVLRKQLDYWKDKLSGLPVLQLPLDEARPAFQATQARSHLLRVGQRLTEEVKSLGRRYGATPFMVLLAAFKVLLARHTAQEDIAVGSYVANRNRAEIEGLIGFFVNTLVFRSDLSGNPSFVELLQQVKANTLGGYENQEVPFPMLVAELQPARDLSRNPLFQVVFQLFNAPTAEMTSFNPMQAVPHVHAGTAILDLGVHVWEAAEGFWAQFEYDTQLFADRTIELLASRYLILLEDVVRDPQRKIGEVRLLSATEKRKLLKIWTETRAVELPRASVVELFEDRARQSGDRTAFLCNNERLEFAELNRRANRLAKRLTDLGVEPGSLVGVHLDRSFGLATAMLGVFKAGGGYLPLDPSYPDEHVRFMISDSGVEVLVTESRYLRDLSVDGIEVCLLDELEATPSPDGDSNPGLAIDPESIAYVIYTSGSTGQPKGVAVPHRQVLNRLAWMWREYPFAEGEVACLKTAVSFVDSLWELLGGLLVGTPTLIVPERPVSELEQMVRDLAEHRVSRIWLVPSLLRALLELYPDLQTRLPDLRFWVVSGEALTGELLAAFRRALPAARLYNLYGASEFWDATWYDTDDLTEPRPRVPIGKPIDNMQVYVLDSQLQPCPAGVCGELLVSGVGLARGYLGRPELQEKKFVSLPFADVTAFRTGDLARFLADGNLEYIGRVDDQVKIRGFRVEPTEIESTLAQVPGVRRVAVVAVEEPAGGSGLRAFVAADGGSEIEVGELRRYLQGKLPPFMVPASFIVVDDLPLTPSGKVDRRALGGWAEPPVAEDEAFVAPRNETEERLEEIWKDLLGVRKIGVHVNFFDIGAHSLLVTRAASKIRTSFGRELPLRVFFESPTIAALAAEIERRGEASEAEAGKRQIPRLSRDKYRIPAKPE